MDQPFALTEATLRGRTLICTVNPTCMQGKETIADGQVISVNEDRKTVLFIYLAGYKSCTDEVPFADILGLHDHAAEQLEIGPYSGPFIDLRQKE